MMALLDAIIVGAGMAGLVCARRLQQAGYQVAILEKSRGLGGRMATRRLDGIPLDHGARFLQPQGARLTYLAKQLAHQGVLESWQPQSFSLDSTGRLSPAPLPLSCYVAPEGMSAVGKAIAVDLTIFRQQRVTGLSPQSDGWQICAAQQMGDSAVSEYGARAVVFAIPAPQILPLLGSIPSPSAVAELATAISAVTYAPCITVLAQYGSPLVSPSGPLPCAPATPWMVEAASDTSFYWIGLDSSKRPTDGLNVVLHSSAPFAEAHIEAAPLQTAGETLLAQASQLISPWLATPQRWQVHRWRYARVTTPCSHRVLGVHAPLPLIACGDWSGTSGIETALESGWQAAAHVNENLEKRTLSDFWTVF